MTIPHPNLSPENAEPEATVPLPVTISATHHRMANCRTVREIPPQKTKIFSRGRNMHQENDGKEKTCSDRNRISSSDRAFCKRTENRRRGSFPERHRGPPPNRRIPNRPLGIPFRVRKKPKRPPVPDMIHPQDRRSRCTNISPVPISPPPFLPMRKNPPGHRGPQEPNQPGRGRQPPSPADLNSSTIGGLTPDQASSAACWPFSASLQPDLPANSRANPGSSILKRIRGYLLGAISSFV